MKFRIISSSLSLMALTACTTMKPAQTGQNPAHFDGVIEQKISLDYLAYVPDEAAQDPGKKWPTLIFLHGSGERGTNVWDVTKHGPPKIVKDKKDFGFIVISPQCPPGQSWNSEAVVVLVKSVEQLYPIDPDRVYLTGLSMGGFGTWSTALTHPELFAAAVPICGGGNPGVLLHFGQPAKLEALKRLPIWAFHGVKDPTVPVAESQKMVKAVQDIGGNAKLTTYPEAQHDSWTETYANPELYRWLLEHDRKTNAPL